MALYLLAGTPGQSKATAAAKIAAFLRGAGITVGTPADVDEELVKYFPEDAEPGTTFKEPRVRIIGERAQDEIRDKWPDAYRDAVKKATSGGEDVAIVLLCFEYYRYETYEFYLPVDCNALRDPSPRGALTLIDDVFDIYYRLSRRGQVFDIQELIERTFPISPSDQRDPNDLRRLYKDALGVTIGSLLRLLTWREKEIDCAANVTRMIGCKHSVLAAKHPVEIGARLLLGAGHAAPGNLGVSYPVYVSHPISRPRRDRLNRGAWPRFVADLDQVVAELSPKPAPSPTLPMMPTPPRILPIMPTAIDELRILDDGAFLHPRLTPHWPLQAGELLYSLPAAPAGKGAFRDYEDFEERGLPLVFDPPIDQSGRQVGLPLSDPEVSGMLRNLRESIRLQMAGRDHLLVRQCPGFFLYRPLFGEYEFSGGVTSEIHTYDQIRKYSGGGTAAAKRRVAFVHDAEDAAGLFKRTRQGEVEFYPDPVHQASAALTKAAAQLVGQSGVKTKRPRSPEDESVARALRSFGDVEKAAKKLHDEMFPRAKGGSIGVEQPLDWDSTKKAIVETVQMERTKALSGDLGHDVAYTYAEGNSVYDLTQGSGSSDTRLDIVVGLDKEDMRRKAAARAREFFAGGHS